MSRFDCGSQRKSNIDSGAGSVRRNPSVISRCAPPGFDTALGEEAVLGRVDGLRIGRNRRDPLHAGLLAAKMLWVAVVAGTPAIRRISSCTVCGGECSTAYKEASFAGSTRHDIHQVSVEYLARIIRRIIELEGPIHQDEIVIRWTRRLSEDSAAQSVISNAVEPFVFDTESPEIPCPALFHSTSPPKRALLCVSTASRLVAARLASRAPGSWWCKHRDRRGADSENETMATKQTCKQAKTKAEVRVDRSANNRSIATSEHEAQHRNRRARSRSGAARTDRAGATAAALKASLNGSEVIHNPEKAPSYSKP